MPRALVIVDVQNDYFPGGAVPLVGPEAAAEVAAAVLAGFRERGEPVVHVQHVWDADDATFFRPGTPGAAIHRSVAPADGEPVVTKTEPNAFLGTDLAERLAALHGGEGADAVVVLGMMTSMCIDATVRSASERGLSVTVVGDACAAPDLEHDGTTVPARMVHAAFLAALADGYAEVVKGADLS